MPAPTETTLIDAVDADDEPVGVVARGEALREGTNFRTAHVFVLNSRGELLMQRLAQTRRRHPGRWGSSVAAYIYAGEGYRAAASRRLYEELGLRTPLKPVGKIRMRDEQSLKFVALFLTTSARASRREPSHIAELAFWPLRQLEVDVEAHPDRFTPTFVQLYRLFRGRAGEQRP